jgi:hypothetical protein
MNQIMNYCRNYIPRIAYIDGKHALGALRNVHILNKTISISNCHGNHIICRAVMPIFKETETLFLKNCDKDFLNEWINKTTFPQIKTIYYLDRPCERYFIESSFPNTEIYVLDYYQFYKYFPHNHNNAIFETDEVTLETILALKFPEPLKIQDK